MPWSSIYWQGKGPT